MSANKLMSPAELKQLSDQGLENYKKSVLEGQTLKNIINSIEDAALNGYTGYKEKLSSDDDIRELTFIRDYLKEQGYYCEIETTDKTGLLGMKFKERIFVVGWSEQK
ncbi:hypothetical protein [Heyndrickxia sporothermodurans]|uniref:hypothetical protein n=1 Tax=Heyndrickxia sporothermodurans TaxID=46224 RepID=UPI0035DDF09D